MTDTTPHTRTTLLDDHADDSSTADASGRSSTPDDRPRSSAESPVRALADGWRGIGRRTVEQVSDDQVPMMAAAVAFAGFLSIFPAIIAAVTIYGLVTDPATALDQARSLTQELPSDAASLITGRMQSVADTGGTALGLGLAVSVLGALWGASGGMSMLIKGVNTAYDEDGDRGFARTRLLSIGFALGAILFAVVTVLLVGVVPSLLADLGPVGAIAAQVGRWVLLAGLIVVALAVVYRYAPDRADARWVWISPGAVVASLLWLLATAAFSLFVSSFGSYEQTYGSVAGVAVLMLWLQITAFIVLLGAEFNAEVERQTAEDTTTGEDDPLGARGAEAADEARG